MKKVIALLFIVVIGIGITGCDVASGNNQNAEDVPNNVSGNTSEKIELTPENIYDYLTISLNVSDVEKEYLGRENSVAEGKITIKTSPRKRGDFNDVIITGTLNTSSAGWVADGKWDSREKKLVIPFDGKYEEIHKIRSNVTESFITTTPSFTLIINSVSGEFVAG